MEFPPRRKNGLHRPSAPANSLGNASTPQLNSSEHTSFACACISMPSATLCPTVLVGHFLSRQRISSLVIKGLIRNLWVIHFTPALHLWVQKPAKLPKKHHHHGHNQITKGQLQGLLGQVSLQQGIEAIWFVMMVRIMLQIDQQPIGRPMCRIP